MIRNIRSELLLVRKRTSTWVILGIWTALALYVLALVRHARVSITLPE